MHLVDASKGTVHVHSLGDARLKCTVHTLKHLLHTLRASEDGSALIRELDRLKAEANLIRADYYSTLQMSGQTPMGEVSLAELEAKAIRVEREVDAQQLRYADMFGELEAQLHEAEALLNLKHDTVRREQPKLKQASSGPWVAG